MKDNNRKYFTILGALVLVTSVFVAAITTDDAPNSWKPDDRTNEDDGKINYQLNTGEYEITEEPNDLDELIMDLNGINEEEKGQLLGPSTYDYVIITTNAIIDNSEELEHFIHMKEFCGHSVKVVTETDFNGLTGSFPNDRADRL
jgi:hypothetical protein